MLVPEINEMPNEISSTFKQNLHYMAMSQKKSRKLGNAFISLEISCSFLIFFSLFSFILAWTFISLQIIEFQIMGLSINDSFYSCVFFFLTGFHFFHLVLGLLLISLFYWSSSFSSLIFLFILVFLFFISFFL